MDNIGTFLNLAADAVNRAAAASRDWEDGGDPDPVADTAWEAYEAISLAIEAAKGIDPVLQSDRLLETRLGRLVLAARLLVLAGTDEDGRSDDLQLAAKVLRLATDASHPS